jgi:hypothetical protein
MGNYKEDIRRALAPQRAIEEAEKTKNAALAAEKLQERERINALLRLQEQQKKDQKRQIKAQLKMLKSYTQQSQLPFLMREVAKEVNGKLEHYQRKELNDTSNHYIILWNIKHYRHFEGGNLFEAWSYIGADIDSQGNIDTGGHRDIVKVDQWMNDPSLIQKALITAIEHPWQHDEQCMPDVPDHTGEHGYDTNYPRR